MADDFEKLVEEQVRIWHGISPPNAAARIMARQLAGVIAGFAALRGTLVFEDEPASFEAALEATKDRE